MGWLNDVASTFGIPAGVTTLAVFIYLGFIGLEKQAQKSALNDLSVALKRPISQRALRGSYVIENIFTATFGEKHLSWMCVRRSVRLIPLSQVNQNLGLAGQIRNGAGFGFFGRS